MSPPSLHATDAERNLFYRDMVRLRFFLRLSRFKHVAVSDGASDQQRGGQPCGAAAGAVFPAAPQPPPAEPDAAVPQPHEPAAIHGYRHTLAQSVTLSYLVYFVHYYGLCVPVTGLICLLAHEQLKKYFSSSCFI